MVRKPCPQGSYRHRTTKRCRKLLGGSKIKVRRSRRKSSPKKYKRKPCPQGLRRSRTTGRCRKFLGGSKVRHRRSRRRSRRRSSPKKRRSSPKKRSSVKKYKACKPGYYRHPSTHRCRKGRKPKSD